MGERSEGMGTSAAHKLHARKRVPHKHCTIGHQEQERATWYTVKARSCLWKQMQPAKPAPRARSISHLSGLRGMGLHFLTGISHGVWARQSIAHQKHRNAICSDLWFMALLCVACKPDIGPPPKPLQS